MKNIACCREDMKINFGHKMNGQDRISMGKQRDSVEMGNLEGPRAV